MPDSKAFATPLRRLIGGLGSLFLLLTALGLLATLLSWWLLPRQSQGNFPRQVEHSVVVPAQAFDVSILGEILEPCPDRPVSAVLVLDTSSSMGPAVEQVRESVQMTLGKIDWTSTQLGVVLSRKQAGSASLPPDAILPLASDISSVLQMLELYMAGGETQDDLGLGDAMRLVAIAPTGNLKVIILLSDGGTHFPEVLIQAVESLKNSQPDVRIVLLGYQTGENLPLLQEIGQSGPCCQFFAANDPQEMADFYANLPTILEGLGQQTTITYQEPVNLEKYIMVDDALSIGITRQQRGIPQTPVVIYSLQSRQLGWHTVVMEGGSVNFTDCDGSIVDADRAGGPVVLTTLPWWVWLLQILTGFLLLFAGWWSKKPKPKIPLAETVSSKTLPIDSQPPPTEIVLPAWLANVPGLKDALPENKPPLLPTFFISLGPTSRPVLERIAQNFDEVWDNERPQDVHLLHIDVVPKGSDVLGDSRDQEPYRWLRQDEIITLTPDLQQYADLLRNDPHTRYHLDWWKGNHGGRLGYDYDRCAGRLGIFSELGLGVTNSRLWESLKQGVELKNTSVWIIASAADWAGSSLAYDIAHLVRQAGKSATTVGSISLVLLLQNVSIDELCDEITIDSDNKNRRAARVYATFREVARFNHNQLLRFRYNPNAVNQPALDSESNESRLIEDIYVVDSDYHIGAGDLPEPVDSSSMGEQEAPDSRNVVGALAEALSEMALAPVWANVGSQLQGIRNRIENLRTIRGDETFLLSLGCCSYNVPFRSLMSYASSRLAYDVLSNQPRDDLANYIPGFFAEVFEKKFDLAGPVSAWFRGQGNSAVQHPFWTWVADIAERRIRQNVANSQNAEAWFKIKFVEKVVLILNGEDAPLRAAGSNRLYTAIGFCREVKRFLVACHGRGDSFANETVQKCLEWPELLSEDLETWERVLSLQVRALRKETADQQNRLEKEFAFPSQWVPTAVRDVAGYYTQQVRASGQPNKDLLSFSMARIGWLPKSTKPDQVPAIDIGMVPAWGTVNKIKLFDSQHAEKEEFRRGLRSLSFGYLTQRKEPTPASLLSEKENRERLAQWLITHSEAMISFSAGSADQSAVAAGYIQQAFILSQGQVDSKNLSEYMAEEIKRQSVQVSLSPLPLESLTPHACTLLRVIGPLPLGSLKAYTDARQEYRSTSNPERLMVFSVEQLEASCHERLGREGRFSPEMWPILQDVPLLQLFVALSSMGLIHQKEQSIILKSERTIVLSESGHWPEALDTFVNARAVDLQNGFSPDRRPGFVTGLYRAIQKQRQDHSDDCERARLDFNKLIRNLLEKPDDTLDWQLGVIFEHFLDQEI